MTLKSINPATLEVVHEIEELTSVQLEKKITQAQNTFLSWREVPITKRAKLMKKAGAELRKQKTALAKIITNEVGKTLKASEAEIEKCAIVCDYYAEESKRFLQPEIVPTESAESYVRFEPLGIILAVMPWNFPFWQVFRFAAPALMAGNVGVLKHASNVQGSASAIENIFTKAGFPKGAFTNLSIGSSKVASVIEDARIKAVTLTGSEKAGSSVASIAGKEIKKTVLELGGSDPFIVLSDADLAKASQIAVSARMQANVGQSCISAKRFIVHKDVVKKFSELLKVEIEKLVVGDPTLSETNVGPMVNEQMVSDIERQVKESVAKGAKILTGGKRLNLKGYFYMPTILTGVTKKMPVYYEETFGPILPIITFKNDDEAIRIANDSVYGLGSTIFSRNIAKAKKLAEQVESGAVFINSQVKSDARLPFGGIKKSGFGRELSHYGIREFVNIKTVSVNV